MRLKFKSLILWLILPALGIAQPTSQTFNVSGTWVCPAGYTANITIEAWGGGGGAGSGSGRQGGGGGGAYASSTIDVTAGSYVITVGTAGAVGSPGGSSSFASTVIALGGSSGTASGGAGGSASGSTGTTKFSGGIGGTPGGGTNGGGGGGGSATASSDGGAGGASVSGTGGAGGTGEGNGGKGGNTTAGSPASDPSAPGVAPGGGGGGRASNGATISSAGAAGRVIVTVNSSSLPVSLTSFTVKATPVPFLEWQTATERNNSHFEVERSGDGATFEKIGEVAGKGNSVEEVRYSFEDKAPLSGVNYYRLRQVDFDGAFEYSAVRNVVFGSTKKVTVFPAPVASVMTIQLDEAFKNDAQWQITDMAGRLVAEGVFVAEQNQLNIPVNNLTEGVYVLRIVAAQETITRQFRKI